MEKAGIPELPLSVQGNAFVRDMVRTAVLLIEFEDIKVLYIIRNVFKKRLVLGKYKFS